MTTATATATPTSDKPAGKRGRRKSAVSRKPSGRPLKRDFMKDVVIGSNAAVINDAALKDIKAKPGSREFRKELKARGMQVVRIFQKEDYDKATQAHRDTAKERMVKAKETMISSAFKDAGAKPEPRIERAVKTVLPLFRGVNEKRAARALRNMVRSVVAVVPTPSGRRPRRAKKDDQQAQPAQPQGDQKGGDQKGGTVH